MSEYIEREAVIAALTEFREDQTVSKYATVRHCLVARGAIDRATKAIESLPADDVAPVVHGRWIEKMAPYGGRYFECSNCGAHENIHTAIKGYYCWRCGARMDGDSDAKAD